MASSLLFPDPRAAADLLTFAGRAARLADPSVRLRAASGTMAVSAAPLSPRGFGDDTPTVLAMRFVACDPELVCDLVVDAGALSAGTEPGTVVLPDSGISAAWAGISPPRSGWDAAGALSSAALSVATRRGIADVAAALPDSPGEDLVHSVRGAIWGRAETTLGGVVAGAAFAADALGFLADEEPVAVYRTGTWTRLTLARGHVLVRTGNPTGLTAVRSTGRG
jgi:hypothetical protein